MTPKITLSLMVTNAKELATMLEILNHHNAGDSDLAKQARAERDEAMTSAVGWKAAATDYSERFATATNTIETLTQHSESLADQVERATQLAIIRQLEIDKLTAQLRRATCHHPEFTIINGAPICDTCESVVELAEQMRTDAFTAWAQRNDPDHPNYQPTNTDPNHAERILKEQELAAWERLRRDVVLGKSAPICTATRDGHRCERTAGHIGDHGRNLSAAGKRTFAVDYWSDDNPRLATPEERAEFDQRLSASLDDGNQAHADLHPDEDPRDHDAHTCERGTGCCDS